MFTKMESFKVTSATDRGVDSQVPMATAAAAAVAPSSALRATAAAASPCTATSATPTALRVALASTPGTLPCRRMPASTPNAGQGQSLTALPSPLHCPPP